MAPGATINARLKPRDDINSRNSRPEELSSSWRVIIVLRKILRREQAMEGGPRARPLVPRFPRMSRDSVGDVADGRSGRGQRGRPTRGDQS